MFVSTAAKRMQLYRRRETAGRQHRSATTVLPPHLRCASRVSVGLDRLSELRIYIADIDGDGVIISADAVLVLRYCLGFEDGNSAGKPTERN